MGSPTTRAGGEPVAVHCGTCDRPLGVVPSNVRPSRVYCDDACMTSRPTREERRDQIREMRADGLTLSQIAKRLGITKQGVSQSLKAWSV